MKLSDARDLVALIQAAYPRQPWPDPTVALFAEELARLPISAEVATVSIRRMIRDRQSEFAPALGEILSAIVRDGIAAPSFADAWAAMSAAASHGDYFHPNDPPDFPHQAIMRLALKIGWRNFTEAEPSDSYFRHASERLYGDILDRLTSEILASPAELMPQFAPREISGEIRELVVGIGTSE